jgi:hypothetical protein
MVEIANNVPDGISNTTTGTTVNAYVDALDWPCLGFSNKTIHLKNTDGAHALKYKLLSYAFKDGNVHEEVAETILAVGAVAQLTLTKALAQVKVQVKSSVGDSHATFRVDYTGNRS